MLSKAKLIELIDKHHLSDHKDLILNNSKPGIHIQREYVAYEDTLPIGASKMGGNPDLPANFEWKKYEGAPLTFLFQIRLSDVAPYDVEHVLPKTGWLHFFYYIEWEFSEKSGQQNGWEVHYIPDDNTPLKRTTHPTAEGKYTRIEVLPAFKLMFNEMCTPSKSETLFNQLETAVFKDRYIALLTFMYVGLLSNDEPLHRILGNPDPIQVDPAEDAETESNRSRFPGEDYSSIYERVKDGFSDWRLLFQVDSDYNETANMDLMFGDGGTLYYMIREQDLKARQFDKTWLVWQCH